MNTRIPVVLGIDIGTSATKYVAVRIADGKVHDRVTKPYSWKSGETVNVNGYIAVVDDLIREAQQRFEIRAVAVSSQMYSLLTRDGTVIGWNSSWKSDPTQPSARPVDILKNLPGSGAQPDTIFPAFKLADSEKNSPRLRPFGIKAAVMKHLTGDLVIDPAEASATGMYDVNNMRWISPLPLDGIDRKDPFPIVLPHDEAVGSVRSDLGFLDAFHVAPGLGDGVSASFRGSYTAPTAVNLGTSVAVRSIHTAPVGESATESRDTRSREWVFRIDHNRVVRGGISRAGFGTIELFRRHGYPVNRPTGAPSDTPMFFPWLEGIQWPLWDPLRRSKLLGFSPDHGGAEIGSAVWQSIVYMVAWMVDAISTDGACIVAGGGVKEHGFLDALSRCVGCTLVEPAYAEFFAAEGAALSAASAAGEKLHISTQFEREIPPSNERDSHFSEWTRIASRS